MEHKKNLIFLLLLGLSIIQNQDAWARQGHADDDDGHLHISGVVSALSTNSVTIDGVSYLVTNSTGIEHASSSGIGVLAKVEAIQLSDGTFQALSIEYAESADDNKKSQDDSKDRGGDNSSTVTKFKSRLLVGEGFSRRIKSNVSYQSESKSSGIKSESNFKAQVKIPLLNEGSLASNIQDARALNLIARLSREGLPYAECYLEVDDEDEDESTSDSSSASVEFKLQIKEKKSSKGTRLRDQKGTCDTDLASDGIQAGLPLVQDGDTVVILSVAGESEVEFLNGGF